MANSLTDAKSSKEIKPVCGIIMPISAMPPKYEASHWSDVRKILDAAIIAAGLTPQIVSDSFESDVIQQRIISNLYDNPVVVCDVSGLNPNVMFELGMRITFKQPVIIVTDDFSSIPFDTKVIEHLGYPRDLHIHQTNEFIEKLSDRIVKLYAQKMDGSFKSFIESFGTYEVLEPTKKVVEADQLILDRIDALDRSVRRIADRDNRYSHETGYYIGPDTATLFIDFGRDTDEHEVQGAIDAISSIFPSAPIAVSRGPRGEATISMPFGKTSEDTRRRFGAQIKKELARSLTSPVGIRWG